MINEISGLIISAGLSRRMGKFKPLMKFGDKTFLENIIYKLDLICSKIIVVTGYNSQLINENISYFPNSIKSKIKVIHNSEYESGMFTSLQKGLENCNSDWIIYHFVDQPNLPNKFYLEFTKQIKKDYDWIQPINKGRKGHPILFNNKIQEIIKLADINTNLREISNSKDINKYFWVCKHHEIFTDIDTIIEYKKMKETK
jgi:molybdenum cofactor cytidylyltransferase